MPRQMPTTPGPRIRAQARGGSLLLTFPIGGRGFRHRRPLPDRPPTLQAFRSVLSETTSVSTRRLIKGSRSYLRRHGVQSRGATISYHKVALAVYRKFCLRMVRRDFYAREHGISASPRFHIHGSICAIKPICADARPRIFTNTGYVPASLASAAGSLGVSESGGPPVVFSKTPKLPAAKAIQCCGG